MLNMLKNPLFQTRYIERNAWHINVDNFCGDSKKAICAKIRANPLKVAYLAPLLLCLAMIKKIHANRHSRIIFRKIRANPLKALYLAPIYALSKALCAKSWNRYYAYLRLLLGKVDMPYFELVLTTRCSLRCESCNNLMQYFDAKNAYTCTLKGICGALDAIFGAVDSIGSVRIIGGEPLLFGDIAKVVDKLENEPKVKSFNLVTNGTMRFKDELLSALTRSKKCAVWISDYSKSPNLSRKLYQKEIVESLESRQIAHHFVFADERERWIAPGKIYKRNRARADIIRNFKSCLMPCVSVMSDEGVPENAHISTNERINTRANVANNAPIARGGAVA